MKQVKTIIAALLILITVSSYNTNGHVEIVKPYSSELKYTCPANSTIESDDNSFVDFSNMEYYKQ